MKHRILLVTVITSGLISGCGLFTKTKSSNEATAGALTTQTLAQNNTSKDDQILQKIEFKTGISSVTVERLALQSQCTSKQGAAQLTPKAPIEVYRVSCDDGRVFMAKCELRQCQTMMSK
jgi:hypothetical protein